MKSNMRTALGLKPRGHLALESEEGTADVVDGENLEVVMKGPLASVYSDALNVAFNKDGSGDPAAPAAVDDGGAPASDPSVTTPEPADGSTVASPDIDAVPAAGDEVDPEQAATAEKVTAVVLESMQQDAAVMQNLQSNIVTEEPVGDGAEFMTLYAVDKTDIQAEDVINVTELLKDSDKPENVTVLIDDVMPPEGDVPSPEQVSADASLVAGLESLVIGLGGKVVRSFHEFVAAQKKS